MLFRNVKLQFNFKIFEMYIFYSHYRKLIKNRSTHCAIHSLNGQA